MKAELSNRIAEIAQQIAMRKNVNFTFVINKEGIIEGCRNRKSSETYTFDVVREKMIRNSTKMGDIEGVFSEAIDVVRKEETSHNETKKEKYEILNEYRANDDICEIDGYARVEYNIPNNGNDYRNSIILEDSEEKRKADIINNSYSVELSNGQVIYVDKISSRVAVNVYLENDKYMLGHEKVFSVAKDRDMQDLADGVQGLIDEIEFYAMRKIKYPCLIDSNKMEDYHAAEDSLTREIVDAVLRDVKPDKEVMAQVEEGEFYEKIKEEIDGLKAVDETLYTSKLARSAYLTMKDDLDHHPHAHGKNPLGMSEADIRLLLFHFKKKHPEEVSEIVKSICEKCVSVKEYAEWLDNQDL